MSGISMLLMPGPGRGGNGSTSPRRGSYVPRLRKQMLPQRHNEDLHDMYIVDEKVLGSGAFGSVKRAIRKRSKKERVVKSMLKSEIADPDAIHNEILIQSDLDHPHICRLYDTFETADELHIVMEFCKGGDLSDAICDAEKFIEDDARHFMLQVLQAVNYMHHRAIAHRDLKPENFLLSGKKSTPFTENHLKLIDFGFAATFKPGERTMQTKCGTPHYLAPEVFYDDFFSEKCDMWSCGVILYLFLCGEPPFDGDEIEDIVARAKEGKLSFESEVWNSVSKTARLAVMQMCNVDVDKRFSAAQALESPWIIKSDEMTKAPSLKSEQVLSRMRQFKQSSTLRKAAVHLVAYSLGDAELETMRQSFTAMDKNGDGMLSLDELKAAMGDMANLAEVEGLFRQADTDGSGQLEYTEFLSALASSAQLSCKQACAEAFRVLDKDNDGRISLEEVKEVLGREGKDITQSELESVDGDGDGNIDFEEFRKIMLSGVDSTPQAGWGVSSMTPGGLKSTPLAGPAANRRASVSAGLKFEVE